MASAKRGEYGANKRCVRHAGRNNQYGTHARQRRRHPQNVYVLVVDLANLVNGDVVELRLKTKAITGQHIASRVLRELCECTNRARGPYSIPVPVDTEIIATLEQTAGTGAGNFDWNLLTL